MSQHTVVVEFDQSMHPGIDFDALDEESKLTFAALDTSYKLLREYAARAVLTRLREVVGEELESDEELLRAAGSEGSPASYLDLSGSSPAATLYLSEAFGALVDATVDAANAGFGEASA